MTETATETPVVVVTGATAEEPPPGIDAAEALATLRYAADGTGADAIDGADAVFAWWRGREILEDAWDRAGSLRWIQCASDGVDGMLFPALVESAVEVTNARGVFDDPIAEWAIAAILAFRTGLHRSIVDTTRRRWDDDRSRRPVEESHLVVVGPGPIGRAAARRARDLGMTVTMVGRAPRRDADLGPIVGPDGFHAALATADHVLDALPLAEGTRRLFDAGAFEAMKPGAVFVNVGRGGTVDEPALLDALARGQVAGAALDVFDDEPIPDGSPLWDPEHVIVSPHICGDVEGWEAAVVGVFVDNLGRFARGEPLRNLVDKRAGFGVGVDPRPMAERVIEVEGLRKRYGELEAVRGIDLHVERGEVFALLGPNGAGKTTTTEILEGYRTATSGEVRVLGHDPAQQDRGLKERIGIVLQSTGVDPFLTVRETIEMYGGYYPAPRETDEVIDVVGLAEKRDARVVKLSGGQQRRLDVAIALAGDPELLFLDEPTTGFDPNARRNAWEVVKNLVSIGKTVFLTTHFMDEAQYLADRVAVIAKGEIVAEGPPDTLAGRDRMRATIRFRTPDGAPTLPDRGQLRADDGAWVLYTDDPTTAAHEVTGWAVEGGFSYEVFEVAQPSLEDVYLELTGGDHEAEKP